MQWSKKIHNFLNLDNVLDIQTDNKNNYEHFTYHMISYFENQMKYTKF